MNTDEVRRLVSSGDPYLAAKFDQWLAEREAELREVRAEANYLRAVVDRGGWNAS